MTPSGTPTIVRSTVPVMGNTAHITVIGGDTGLIDHATARLRRLEQLWSRFIPTSEISLLNAARGSAQQVSPETATLVRYMIAGWSLTDGLFDPTMLGELVRDGYGRSLVGSVITVLPTGVEWSKDLGGATVDDTVVTLPAGLMLDPGGIGKGLAADLVASELVAHGAMGAFVSVGGDVRCIGNGDCDGSWIIDIESPWNASPIGRVAFADGAVATSSLTAKTFPSPHSGTGSRQSHFMDPHLRRSVDADSRRVVQSTVIASECVWAEIFTKAYLALDDPLHIEFAPEHGLEAMLVRRDGTTTASQGWNRFVP